MSHLIVITFEDTHQAGEAFEALKRARSEGFLKIDDAAVIVKDEEGKVHVKNTTDTGTKWGAVGGGAVGLLLASVFFPLAGLAIGAIAGGLIGKSLDMGIDKKFVKDVTESLTPGSSALFVMGKSENPDAVAAYLRNFKGTVYQTTLSEAAQETLEDALKGQG